MNHKEKLNALKERVSDAEKALKALASIDAKIHKTQAEVSAISADATGHPAKLRSKLATKLADLEVERTGVVGLVDLALSEPFQPAALV